MIGESPWTAFIVLFLVFVFAQLIYVGRVNPEVLEHRMWPGKGVETWDWVWAAVFGPALIAIFVVAYRDIEAGRALLPTVVWPIGVALFVLGGGLFLRAMAENPFFEKTVRIQNERGHHVIDTGPYRTVRHPGYVGLVAWLLSLPLLLTSTRALLPTAVAIVSLVVRTALEDRMLRKKLPGYADYTERVRSRLIPRVW